MERKNIEKRKEKREEECKRYLQRLLAHVFLHSLALPFDLRHLEFVMRRAWDHRCMGRDVSDFSDVNNVGPEVASDQKYYQSDIASRKKCRFNCEILTYFWVKFDHWMKNSISKNNYKNEPANSVWSHQSDNASIFSSDPKLLFDVPEKKAPIRLCLPFYVTICHSRFRSFDSASLALTFQKKEEGLFSLFVLSVCYRLKMRKFLGKHVKTRHFHPREWGNRTRT